MQNVVNHKSLWDRIGIIFSPGNIHCGDQKNCLENQNAHLGSAAGGGGTPDPENFDRQFCVFPAWRCFWWLQVVLATHQRSAGWHQTDRTPDSRRWCRTRFPPWSGTCTWSTKNMNVETKQRKGSGRTWNQEWGPQWTPGIPSLSLPSAKRPRHPCKCVVANLPQRVTLHSNITWSTQQCSVSRRCLRHPEPVPICANIGWCLLSWCPKYLRTQVVPVMSITTGWPGGDGGAVTVTRIEAESSPFSFWAKTLRVWLLGERFDS